ncbi:MAG TPA: HlyD family efflux transporter periplasmic adaptor subunit [Verrucomicrobiae bacterium]|nr:HlyD family efflux transporter periplasmic adaptor subunit [Verrucomicrobiae bacterium]
MRKKNPNDLPPIPTPISAVWRELRIQLGPVFVFLVVVAVVIYLWRMMPPSTGLRGIGEGARSLVTSPRPGVVQRLEVQPYQWVEAGDPLLTILPLDPDAQLDLLQSELQLTRLRLEPSTADQNALNFEQVRVDALRLKQELAMARVNLERAESALQRNQALLKEQLVSQDLYEITLRDRDFYTAELKEKTASLAEIESRLAQLRSVGEPQFPGTNQLMTSLIERLEKRLAVVETNWSSLTLFAPISGRVHMIARQDNEFVVEGEPLVMIASPQSDRIVAYLRQPFKVDPHPGMTVDVVLQNQPGQKFTTRITQVGAQLEAITNGLAFVQQGALVDMGLPIILSVPSQVHLRPGEMVAIALRSRTFRLLGAQRTGTAHEPTPLAQARP